ncbi:amiloride-sensitive sodium channel subunit beta isoform X2 [Patella vulgata]|nr:amiloride-sensitive sodium channel subunit beta isoform X2 [Patella vulgata]
MTVCMSLTLASLLRNYKAYPFNTVVKIEPKTQLDFPTITVCDLNYADITKLEKSKGMFHFFLMHSSFLNIVKVHNTHDDFDLARATTIDKLFKTVNTTTDDLFKVCLWKNRVIPCVDFWKPVFTDLGRCFVFNHNATDRLSADSTGTKGGLSFIASINQAGYLVSDSPAAGLKVSIHDPDEPPQTANYGILASPGASTSIGIRKTSYKFLPAPFKAYGDSSCIVNDDPSLLSKMKYSSVYNRETCIRECLGELTVKNCSCKSVTEPDFLPYPYCTLQQLVDCYRPLLDTYYGNDHAEVLCDCPRLCFFNLYHTRTSMAMFPSVPATRVLTVNNVIDEQRDARTGVLDITIFYENFLLEEIHHVGQYSYTSVIGTVGGQMGLFLGASIITIAEFIEILLWSVRRSFGKIRQRLKIHETNAKADAVK